ncbi:hypothetical protein GCM10025778_21320 [Paeniglutamicibacter antarcticus]|uniref:DUF4158 domain-containing protein n=1 Tax=Paeniglutamicibacter antarcticus TaxID=494023 RepID=A0ABP9TLB6_9MICC
MSLDYDKGSSPLREKTYPPCQTENEDTFLLRLFSKDEASAEFLGLSEHDIRKRTATSTPNVESDTGGG